MSDFQREQRKNEHVEIAMAQSDAPQSDFDRVRFVHHSIPNINVDEVDLTSRTTDFDMTYPIYINAMTGAVNGQNKLMRNLQLSLEKLD